MRPDINVVLGGVGLIKGDIRECGLAMVEITREINPYLVEDGFLKNAPFELLNGIIRFGTKFDPYAEVGPLSRRRKELPFAVEVEMAPLKRATREEVKTAFQRALIPALFAIAEKYGLPTNGLRKYSELKGFLIRERSESDE
jgi:hypothetical protein